MLARAVSTDVALSQYDCPLDSNTGIDKSTMVKTYTHEFNTDVYKGNVTVKTGYAHNLLRSRLASVLNGIS
jgi:hypothetical protein